MCAISEYCFKNMNCLLSLFAEYISQNNMLQKVEVKPKKQKQKKNIVHEKYIA